VSLPRSLVPWLITVAALPIVVVGLDASSQDPACDRLPGAFGNEVRTEQSDVLGGLVASHCETTDIGDGAVVAKTVVNWSGLVAGVAFLLGLWLLAGLAVGTVSRRIALTGTGAAMVAILAALLALFL
jgi:hypothetical protein